MSSCGGGAASGGRRRFAGLRLHAVAIAHRRDRPQVPRVRAHAAGTLVRCAGHLAHTCNAVHCSATSRCVTPQARQPGEPASVRARQRRVGEAAGGAECGGIRDPRAWENTQCSARPRRRADFTPCAGSRRAVRRQSAASGRDAAPHAEPQQRLWNENWRLDARVRRCGAARRGAARCGRFGARAPALRLAALLARGGLTLSHPPLTHAARRRAWVCACGRGDGQPQPAQRASGSPLASTEAHS